MLYERSCLQKRYKIERSSTCQSRMPERDAKTTCLILQANRPTPINLGQCHFSSQKCRFVSLKYKPSCVESRCHHHRATICSNWTSVAASLSLTTARTNGFRNSLECLGCHEGHLTEYDCTCRILSAPWYRAGICWFGSRLDPDHLYRLTQPSFLVHRFPNHYFTNMAIYILVNKFDFDRQHDYCRTDSHLLRLDC